MNGLAVYSPSKMQELSGICECFGSVFPQWSSADAEIKVPQLRTRSCQGFSELEVNQFCMLYQLLVVLLL